MYGKLMTPEEHRQEHFKELDKDTQIKLLQQENAKLKLQIAEIKEWLKEKRDSEMETIDTTTYGEAYYNKRSHITTITELGKEYNKLLSKLEEVE